MKRSTGRPTGQPPGQLVAKYTNDILKNIDRLKDSVEKCDPHAIKYSAKIIRISKEALEKGIVEKSDDDKWWFMIDNLNTRFTNKCSCIEKKPLLVGLMEK